FDHLSEAEQLALRGASVAGDRFPVSLLANESPELDQVERACEALAERRLFIQPAGISEFPNGTVCAHYQFRHPLYRHGIYGRLSDAARVRLHRATGERLEALDATQRASVALDIAGHFEKGREYGRAIQYLMLAAGNAASRFAVRDSLDVLQHALSLVP